ncbi:nicotinamidase-related amidase [Rubricella aquisinus]|uniref:Nicotinamidase-related amidase n=1 Tax=Rubricella aquisinus TaxID=2028108 RepID=A0A840X3H4_9RHOB|nr:cysteine hydrolase family protein [Rubricella aquisinus]MBB5516385.1 nicotinamidase-related amidase [Rubricella aquisinus]
MTATLILVDIQKGMDVSDYWGPRNNPDAEQRAADLLHHWRAQNWPVIHVRHDSTNPKSPLQGPGIEIKDEVAPLPHEPVLTKSVNSGFIGTDLEARLRNADATDLVICGITTPHCVSTTVRMAANLGFTVQVAADACATFAAAANTSFDDGPSPTAEEVHRAALSHLHTEFATVTTSDKIIAG